MAATVDERDSRREGGWAGRARTVLGPLIRPAGAGALLGVIWLLASLLRWDRDAVGLCHSDEDWGCLGFGLLMLYVVFPLVGALVGWVLLRVAGVRPAWRVAALGGVLELAAEHLFSRAEGGLDLGSYTGVLLLSVVYAAAAAVVLPGVGSLRRWGVLAVVLLLMWPLTAVL